MASIAAAASAILAGCGGGLGSRKAQSLILSAAKGRVVLPPGSGVRVSQVMNLFGKSTPYADGTFDFASAADAPLLTTAYGTTGGAVLHGLLQQGSAELSARSTAVVLGYYVLGVGAYPAEVQKLYVAAIAGAASAGGLESAIAAAIVARGEGWLDPNDGTLVAALVAMQHELSAGAAAHVANAPATRGVILDKTGRVSGLQINADGAGSMTITNFYRRRSYLYVDRVSYKAKGSPDPIPHPGAIPPQPMMIPPTRGISNALANLGAFLGGQHDFYEPVISDKVGIPVDPKDAASTTYTVTDVGIGVGAGDLAKLTQAQMDGWLEVTIQSIVIDILAPILAGVVLPLKKQSIDAFTDFAGASGMIKDLINAVAASPSIRSKVRAGQVSDACWEALLLIAKSDTLRNVFLQMVGDFIESTFGRPDAPFGLNGQLLVIGDRAEFLAKSGKALLSFISNLNIVLQVLDSVTTGLMVANCNLADVFTLEVTNAIAKLNPDKSTADRSQAAITFTAAVTNADLQPDTLLNYQWTCACLMGDISDGVKSNKTDGTSFPSNSKSLQYQPNGHAKGGDVEAIKVEVFSGPFNKRVAIGTAASTVTFNTPITPDSTTVPLKGVQTFTAIVSDSIAAGATYEWTVTGGFGSIGAAATIETAVPSITYTAGDVTGQDTLRVRVLAPDRTVITTGSTPVTVHTKEDTVPGRFVVTFTSEYRASNGGFDCVSTVYCVSPYDPAATSYTAHFYAGGLPLGGYPSEVKDGEKWFRQFQNHTLSPVELTTNDVHQGLLRAYGGKDVTITRTF